MARTPKKLARQASRPARASAPTTFVNHNEDTDFVNEFESDGEDNQDEERLDDEALSNILQVFSKNQAKNATSRPTNFQTQKKVVYATARQKSKEITKAGTAYLEDIKERVKQYRGQEMNYRQHLEECAQVSDTQKKSVNSLLGAYPTLLRDLGPRRSDLVDAASAMIKSNPSQRHEALKKFSKNARAQVEHVRESEKIATDASALIKHYKNLLCT